MVTKTPKFFSSITKIELDHLIIGPFTLEPFECLEQSEKTHTRNNEHHATCSQANDAMKSITTSDRN